MKKMGPILCLLLLFRDDAATAESERYLLPLTVLKNVCAERSAAEVAGKMGLTVDNASDAIVQGQIMGWRATLSSNHDRFRVQRLASGEHFRGARVEWWQREKARLVLTAGKDCQVQIARRLQYNEQGQASAVVHLNRQFNDTSYREPLNPPVPPADTVDGVRVAVVDSGVNYTLPEINQRLARDAQGRILGYDYWDLDRKPFDANPYRSPFFPQRHGTRTASLILREAPGVVLVPYRYPRTDMSRMHDLLLDVKRKNIKIVAMPLGSKRISEWEIFRDSARELQETLFIVSAGNNGVSIDETQIYPAALELENMIVVTSSDDGGRPARGSNWGRQSVDLLVPAENQAVTDFNGQEMNASGSSYAVSRVAAMAARLLEHHAEWSAQEVKQFIYERAVRAGFSEYVKVGFLPDPLAQEGEVLLLGNERLGQKSTQQEFGLKLNLVRLKNSGWDETDLPVLVDELDTILSQCRIQLVEVHSYTLRVSPRLLDFDTATAHTLVTQVPIPRPAVYMVRDTLRQPAYEGEAFGRDNTLYRSWLRDTVWLTAGIAELGIGLAHELFHILINSGQHVSTDGNLMQARTQPGGSYLNTTQCRLARETGLASGLLVHLAE